MAGPRALGNAAPLLRLRAVDKAFGGAEALRGLEFDVADGEIVTLLGPSGCGKSTALRLIAGLAAPTRGRIDWRDGRRERDDLAFVFQEPTLMPWATVERNVWLPLRLAGLPLRAARDRIREALALVGLEGVAGRYPRTLSGGMKMRVSIARALVTRPTLILMDEPFGALDEITRQRLDDDLLALRARTDATIVFVTHSVSESVSLSDRILVMSAAPGRILREIAVDAPGPRGLDWRNSPDYARLVRLTSATLAETFVEASI